MGLILQENDLVFLDTSPFIYFLERHPDFFQYMESFFNQVYEKNVLVITSVVTLIEICTLPARLNNQLLVNRYRDYFTKLMNFQTTARLRSRQLSMKISYLLKSLIIYDLGELYEYCAENL